MDFKIINMNDYQLQLECDLALKRVMHRVDVFIRNEKRLWEFINIWHPMGVYPYYSDDYNDKYWASVVYSRWSDLCQSEYGINKISV